MFKSSRSLIETPPNLGGGVRDGEGESPRNPFSISVILSDEIGQKRSPTSNVSFTTPPFSSSSSSSTAVTPLSRNDRQRRLSTSGNGHSNEHAHSFHTPCRPAQQGSGGGNESCAARSVRFSRMSLSEAGNLANGPVTSRGLLVNVDQPLINLGADLSSSHGSAGSHPHQSHRLTTPQHSNNSSITTSPFNASILQALGQQQVTTPTNKSGDILDDSLGILSTVALLDSEISSNVNTTAGTSVQERLAGMRINSHHDVSVSSHEEDVTVPRCLEASSNTAAVSSPTARKSHTPHILKRDRRRQRKQSLTDSSRISVSSGDSTHLNTGFLSPLAQGHSDQASKQHFTFSPSIFLSRPDESLDPSPPRKRPTSFSGGGSRQGGIGSAPIVPSGNCPVGPLSPSSESDVGLGEEFVTSTPIKSNKENLHGHSGRPLEGVGGAVGVAWSPSILQTSGSARKQFLREANDASSGSDSEVPVKKLKTTPLAHPHQHKRRKTKARTKLSPLLENACSPIAKADHTLQPSPLVTSVTSTPSRATSPPHTQAPSTSSAVIGQLRPPMSAESAQAPPVMPTPSYTAQGVFPHHAHHLAGSLLHQQQSHCQPMTGGFPLLHTSAPSQPMLSPQAALINPALSYPFNPIMSAFGGFVPMQSYAPPVCLPSFLPGMSFYNPQAQTQTMYPTNLSTNVNFVGNTSLVAPKYGKWNGSMCSSPQTSSSHRTQLQSVPPWFIFSDKRADSKRSRLSEAINKSLSETPSQKTKLPAEWSKYACGQTDDQRALTEEARSFLLMRPRQLHFDEEK